MEVVRGDLLKRHSNYRTSIKDIGVKLDFFWAPCAENITDLVSEFKTNSTLPDVSVMGSGLCHMLQIWNSSHYSESLQKLRKSVAALLPYPGFYIDWITSFVLDWNAKAYKLMLNTEEKRKKMTATVRDGYDYAIPGGPGPFLLLDIESLSWNYGIKCTVDGMHYDGVVYETAVHILLNALLIESHQRL